MNKTTNFDVLIVYSEKLANSAGCGSKDIVTPFSYGSASESYNLVYGYFLKICRQNNLTAAFTTSADIIGKGKCQSYWLFKRNVWIKIPEIGFANLIFDKFSPTTKNRKTKRDLLFSSNKVKPFNNPYLFNLCFDKQQTYEVLKSFSIPTVTIKDSTRKSVIKAQKLLKEKIASHKNKSDFSQQLVMKDRFGAGGVNVYKFGHNQLEKITALVKKHKSISFIIQPFVKFDKGFKVQNSYMSTDIRLIYLGKKIVQTYIRMAKKGDFRCNEHAGGLLKYIPGNEVPGEITAISKRIAAILNKKSSLFALDFIISNDGNIYLLEANTGPGLDWNLSIKENAIEAKKLIRIIIKELGRRKNMLKRNYRKAETPSVIDTSLIEEEQYLPNLLTTTQTN